MPVLIIAEAGVNHNGDTDIARQLIDAAKDAGADAVKFQTFKSSRLVAVGAEKARYQVRNTGTEESQLDMLKKLELTYEAHVYLKEYCNKAGILFLSTPFDFESVDLLESINIPAYKISSGDLTNIPLLRYIAGKGKPMILSTGMADLEEIKEALDAIYAEGNRAVTVLHCTTNYPTPFDEVNLNAMRTISKAFNVEVGYSDHTTGIEIPIAAVALGASVIEKHFTLDRTMIGPDHKASLEPDELKQMVRSIRNIENALGDGKKEVTASEKEIMGMVRKSVVAARMIKKGSCITQEDLDIKRPAGGIEPKYYYEIMGKTASRDISEDKSLEWMDID